MFCRILTLLVKRLYPTKHPNFSPRLPTKLMCQASFNRIVHWKCQHWSQKTQLNLCIDATRLRWSKFYSFSTFFRFLIVVYIVYNNEKKRYLFHSFLKRHKKFQNFQTLTKFEVPAQRASRQLLDLQKETSWRQRNCLYIIPFSFFLYNIHYILVMYSITLSHCFITLFAIATLDISIWPLPTSYLGLL